MIGSGGREHALLWKLAQDGRISKLYAVPGNGGTRHLAEAIAAPVHRLDELHRAVIGAKPDLVVVGPEVPLEAGIADRLRRDNIPCFGPTAAAAKIETSKVFGKQLMARHGVPTAEFKIFESSSDVGNFVNSVPYENGWVIKADGLAAGKGAFVCSSVSEVLQHAHELMVDSALGKAGQRIVLERRLMGREASALFWCDGEHFVPLPAAQDYKRAADNDAGPNTGGMGSFCPAPQLTAKIHERVAKEIIHPVLNALADEGAPFCGILYAGLMLTDDGPQVIEFNCRFGDPETQVILPAWNGNMLDTMFACVNGTLSSNNTLTAASQCAVCVVLAAEGYPGSHPKGIPLIMVPDYADYVTFHAGTSYVDGKLISNGGRVLNAVGMGSDLSAARAHAYELAKRLSVPGLFYRKDIALIPEHVCE